MIAPEAQLAGRQQQERRVLYLACYGHFLSHFNMLVFPAVLLPLSERLQLGMSQTLALAFYMYLLFGISALPWGFFADRYGARPLLSLFFAGAGGFGLYTASVVDNPSFFALGLTGIGLFSGIYHPAGLGWLARNSRQTSKAMAINGMFGNLGLAVAPAAAGTLIYFWSVEAVYLLLGVVNLCGLPLLVKAWNKPALEPVSAPGSSQPANRYAPFLVLLAAMTLGGIVYRGTSVSLPAFFELQAGEGFFATLAGNWSANLLATLLTSAIYLVGMLGQYSGGVVGERFNLCRSYLLFHLLTVPAALALVWTTGLPAFLFALIHGFFLLGMQPIENTLVARLTPARLLSSAYGTKFVFTFGFGALGVKVIEIIKDGWGLEWVFLWLAAVSLLLCLFAALLWRLTVKLL